MRRLFGVGEHLSPSHRLARFSTRRVEGGPALAALRSTLHAHTVAVADEQHAHVSGPGERTHAGILVPVFEEGGELWLWLTERSASLSTHGGEISFPGGKTDPGEDDLAAAVREAEEEIGLGKERLEVLGCLPAMSSKKGLVCSPFVAAVDRRGFEPRLNKGEVEDLFAVPIAWLLDEKNMRAVKSDWGLTSFEWVFVRDQKQFRIWGLTGAIVLHLLVHAFKFAPKGINLDAYFRFFSTAREKK